MVVTLDKNGAIGVGGKDKMAGFSCEEGVEKTGAEDIEKDGDCSRVQDIVMERSTVGEDAAEGRGDEDRKNLKNSGDDDAVEEKEEENQVKKKKKKKKNKKKKKKKKNTGRLAVSDLDGEAYAVRHTEGKGRGCFAKGNFSAGHEIIVEKAYAYTSLSGRGPRCCSVCYSPSAKLLGCDVCKGVWYCSENCKNILLPAHKAYCAATAKVAGISKSTGVEQTFLQLMLLALTWKECSPIVEERKSLRRMGWNEVALMPSVQRTEESHDALRLAANVVCVDCPANEEECFDILCKINTNSHSVSSFAEPPHGVGLFPLVALCNHSCDPNCIYFQGPEEGSMIVRTLRPVKNGEELCVSYIDGMLPRKQRRSILQETKGFLCSCARCSAELNESSKDFSSPQWLKDTMISSMER